MTNVAIVAGVSKATVYRRWPSKAELVIDAMATLKPPIDTVDTGSLNGDIEQMIASMCNPMSQRLQQVVISVCSALPREPALLGAIGACYDKFWLARITAMLGRAHDRGELGPNVDVAMAAAIVPSLVMHRALMTGLPTGRVYAQYVVGSALFPVLGCAARPVSATDGASDDTATTRLPASEGV